MADDIRDFMYTKHNGDYKKIRIFSFIPQRQCKQPNFMKDSIRIFIHAKQPNIEIQLEQPKNVINVGFTTNKNAVTTEIMQILEYSYSNFAIDQPISYISSITNFVHFIDPQNSVIGLLSKFVHFIHPCMNSLPEIYSCYGYIITMLC